MCCIQFKRFPMQLVEAVVDGDPRLALQGTGEALA